MKWSILTSVLIATGALARPSRLEAPHRETLEEAGGSRYKHLYRSIKTLTPLPPAVNVKKLVHNVVTGTMASVFPKDSPDAGTSRLFTVENSLVLTSSPGHPFAMMEVRPPCASSVLTSSTMLLVTLHQH